MIFCFIMLYVGELFFQECFLLNLFGFCWILFRIFWGVFFFRSLWGFQVFQDGITGGSDLSQETVVFQAMKKKPGYFL